MIKKIILMFILLFSFVFANFMVFTDGEIKKVNIYDKAMRIYTKGNGDHTIVLLSGWATKDPINDFMPLVNLLSKKHQIVVIEFFGYGLSDITLDERSNENIVKEIRDVLKKLEIKPPYILMPHSMSGLYSLYYVNKFPKEVEAIIGIDASLPQKQLERWTAQTFEKVKLNINSNDFNIDIVDQWNKFYDNSKELANMKYPKNLPILAFLASEQIESVNEMIKSGEMKTSWEEMNKNMITNDKIQYIKILKGSHYLHHTQALRISQLTNNFLNMEFYK